MAGKVSAFITFDFDRRRPGALFVIEFSGADRADIAVLEGWRLVDRRNLLSCGVIVLFI